LRARRWVQRHPWPAAFASVLALGLPTVCILLIENWVNKPRVEAAMRAEVIDQRERLLARASHALTQGHQEHAARLFADALHNDSQCVEAAVGVALSYSSSRDFEAVLRTLDEYRNLLGDSHAACRLKSGALEGLGRDDEARKVPLPRPTQAIDW